MTVESMAAGGVGFGLAKTDIGGGEVCDLAKCRSNVGLTWANTKEDHAQEVHAQEDRTQEADAKEDHAHTRNNQPGPCRPQPPS